MISLKTVTGCDHTNLCFYLVAADLNSIQPLAKMTQVQSLSETAMLDILINRFYEMEYVDIDGKDIY